MFKNFLFSVAGLSPTYTIEDREQKAIEEIRAAAGSDKKVLALVSGGVDSSVCVTLLRKALGSDRVVAIHVDHGFMRKDESAKVKKALDDVGVYLKVINAVEIFANSKIINDNEDEGGEKDKEKKFSCKPLKEVVHPEEKRQIIGDTFMKVAQDEIGQLDLCADNVILAQGTLRPDLIESASKMASTKASVIKTHHNDTNLVRRLRDQGRVVEPLKDYHKDEVRELGKKLGLPEELVWRQPFPGPGLAVRILCCEEPYIDASFDSINEYLKLLLSFSEVKERLRIKEEIKVNRELEKEKAKEKGEGEGNEKEKEKEKEIEPTDQHDAVFVRKLRASFGNLVKDEQVIDTISKEGRIKATVLPIQSVGVQGDGRSYNHVVALTDDGQKNWQHLFFLAFIIPRIIHKVNRVVYVYGSPIPGPIRSVTPTHLTPDVISQLQEADEIVNNSLYQNNLIRTISQVPVVSLPLHFEKPVGYRSIAIRTIITNDFMTGHVAIPGKHFDCAILDKMVEDILTVPGIARVAYDLTSKPPATTEWE